MKILFATMILVAPWAWADPLQPPTPIAPNIGAIEEPARWTHHNVTARSVTMDGRRAAYLMSRGDSANGIVGLALPAGIEFDTGTIEVELKGKNVKQRSFVGVAFNVTDSRTFEAVYFRAFNFKAEAPFNQRAVQYVSWPDHTWEKLRKERPGQFENAVQPVPDPDGWFRARIEVSQTKVRVFVDGAKTPSLVVDRLPSDRKKRAMGLFVDSADGYYANLVVTPENNVPVI